MRIRFSGRDLQMLEALATLRGEHPRLVIKLLIEESYAATQKRATPQSTTTKTNKDKAELDDELPL